jgi:hypothetical protein
MSELISIAAWVAFAFLIWKKFIQVAPKLSTETRAVGRATVLTLTVSPSCFIVPSVGSIIPAPASLVLLSEIIDRIQSPHPISHSKSDMIEISIWSIGIFWVIITLASLFAIAIFSNTNQAKQSDADLKE